MTTTLIKNALVLDGSGRPGFPGAVMIDGDKIKEVLEGPGPLPQAENVIDAGGKAIAPGFIDMHSHADWLLPRGDHTRLLGRLAEQGITSVVGGNCGISPAPFRAETSSLLTGLASITMDGPLSMDWNSMAEFMDRVEEGRPLLNLAELCGHATVRYAASDIKRGPLPPDDLNRALDAARKALDEGAAGISMGLGYDPGMYSSLDELEAFFRVAAEKGKPVTVHLKALSRLSPCYPVTYLGAHNLRALREMLDLAQKTGAKLQLSHFIFVGRNSWSTHEHALAMVEDARRNSDVMIDAFPYTCGNTTILAPVPYWFLAKGPAAYRDRFALARLKVELEIGFRLVGFIYRDFQVMLASAPGWEDTNGLTIDELAVRRGLSPFQTFVRLCEESKGSALMLFHAYSGEPGNEMALEAVLQKDYCLIETDVAIRGEGFPNPAGLGTFPRVLGHFVREKKMISLESAVHRMTGASALRFAIKDRGYIKPGLAADLVIFDPALIADVASEGSSAAGRPRGIFRVLINGRTVVKDGKLIPGARPGELLRI